MTTNPKRSRSAPPRFDLSAVTPRAADRRHRLRPDSHRRQRHLWQHASGHTDADVQRTHQTRPTARPRAIRQRHALRRRSEAEVTLTTRRQLRSTSRGQSAARQSSFTVNPAAMSALALTLAASSTADRRRGRQPTITAVDQFENTGNSYTGSGNLTFGAPPPAAQHPASPTPPASAVELRHSTTASGSPAASSKVSGTSNGVMKLYAPETATSPFPTAPPQRERAARDRRKRSASRRCRSPTTTSRSGFTAGKIESGDSFSVEFGSPVAVSTMCSGWEREGHQHALSGNNEVTVTFSDGTGATNDSLSVTSSACTFHLGTIDLGSNAYVTAAARPSRAAAEQVLAGIHKRAATYSKSTRHQGGHGHDRQSQLKRRHADAQRQPDRRIRQHVPSLHDHGDRPVLMMRRRCHDTLAAAGPDATRSTPRARAARPASPNRSAPTSAGHGVARAAAGLLPRRARRALLRRTRSRPPQPRSRPPARNAGPSDELICVSRSTGTCLMPAVRSS